MCCFWNTRSASSWCFILQYKFDTCIKKKKKKKTDQYTRSFKWKIQKCPWKFSKVPPLNTFYFYAKSKFYLSCTLAHTSASVCVWVGVCCVSVSAFYLSFFFFFSRVFSPLVATVHVRYMNSNRNFWSVFRE